MSRLALAAELIQDHQFELAIEMLKKDASDLKSIILLSYLYRLFDKYDDEKEVIEKGLESGVTDSYLEDRKSWLNLSMFDKTVPRQKLHLPRDPLKVPDSKDIEKLCFITGGDTNYYPLIVECVESIRNTALYKDCDVFVLDCGLTDDQKNHLTEKLNAKVYDPGWDVSVPETNQQGQNGQIAKNPTPIGYKCMVQIKESVNKLSIEKRACLLASLILVSA